MRPRLSCMVVGVAALFWIALSAHGLPARAAQDCDPIWGCDGPAVECDPYWGCETPVYECVPYFGCEPDAIPSPRFVPGCEPRTECDDEFTPTPFPTPRCDARHECS